MRAIILSIFACQLAVASEDQAQAALQEVKLWRAEEGGRLVEQHECGRCHGKTGIAVDDETPSLAGQTQSYTFKQLYDYKHRVRDDLLMFKRANKLTEQEMADMAAWYAAQTPEPKADAAAVSELAVAGDVARALAPCEVCHNKQYIAPGVANPVLAGQKQTYLIDTMLAYKEDERKNDAGKVMRGIVVKLTEDEITALGKFYGAKPAEK